MGEASFELFWKSKARLPQSGFRHHVDAATFSVKLDFAVNQREKGVVLSLADALASVKLGANLTDQNVASSDDFAAKLLHATTLCVGVSAVSA